MEQVKSELSVKQEKENEIDKLKAFHEQELKELEERLQVYIVIELLVVYNTQRLNMLGKSLY